MSGSKVGSLLVITNGNACLIFESIPLSLARSRNAGNTIGHRILDERLKIAASDYVSPYVVAQIYSSLNEHDQAFQNFDGKPGR
jgi:hypothetical protein